MAKKTDEIIPRETPINAPVSFAIMLMASDVAHAIKLYDSLIAAGVQPRQIQANIQQPRMAATQSPTVKSPSAPQPKGKWEIKYNGTYGKMVLKDYFKLGLMKAGYSADTRESCAQAMCELIAAGRMEKAKAPQNGWYIDNVLYSPSGMAGDDNGGDDNAPTGEHAALAADVDLDDVV